MVPERHCSGVIIETLNIPHLVLHLLPLNGYIFAG